MYVTGINCVYIGTSFEDFEAVGIYNNNQQHTILVFDCYKGMLVLFFSRHIIHEKR